MTVRVPLVPRWLRWGFVVAVAGFIFYASIVTVPPETPIDRFRFAIVPLDKWRHLLAYAALAGTLAYATVDWRLRTWRAAALVVTAVTLYGVGIELGQSTVPNRYFSLYDAYANLFGAVLLTPWYLLQPRLEFVGVRTWLRETVPQPT